MYSGIYKIRNIINNKIYVGSAINVYSRYKRHLRGLRKGKHENIKLQRSYNKHGENKFVLEIIELCDSENLLYREQYYLDLYRPYENGYNINTGASGGDTIANHPNREQIIKNITVSIKKRYAEMSDEERKEKFSRPGMKNSNYNNHWSDEQKTTQSNKVKKYLETHEAPAKGIKWSKESRIKLSESCKLKIGEKNPFYGKKHSDETKKKISDKRIGKYFGKQNIPFEINGIIYKSLKEASTQLNIHITTIRYRLNSKNKKFENYKYIEENSGNN